MSVRIKLILALLICSLASIGLVAGVTYQQALHRFNTQVFNRAAQSFQENVTAYYRLYGSWDAALAAESFSNFVQRRKAEHAQIADFGGHGPRRRDQEGQPSFYFLLLDLRGRPIIGAPHFDVQKIDLAQCLPLDIDGVRVGYIGRQGTPNYTPAEVDMLTAIREALLAGSLSAVFLALSLGILLGTRVALPLRRLSQALAAMQQGALEQSVAVSSKDEVGALARAFNDMSAALAKSHAEAQQARLQIEEQAARLQELSVRDGLTGLFNRRHFEEQARLLIERANRQQKGLAIMIGDIDFFKLINDNFLHATGDAVLAQVGAILREQTRATDLVARYGGEEFVIAFDETSLAEALQYCERLRQKIADFPWPDVHPGLAVTISIGLADNRAAKTLDSLLHEADLQLYRAKSAGRNRVCAQE